MEQNDYRIHLIAEYISPSKLSRFLEFCLQESDRVTFSCLQPLCNPKKDLSKVGLVGYKKTRKTHCTEGPLTCIYTFLKESAIKQYIEKMPNWYSPIEIISDTHITLEDPAFYKEGKLMVSICSHEKMASLVLTQAQYEIFHKLRIPHEISNPREPISLEALCEEYVYQERSTLTIMETPNHTMPENIGKITTLKILEIYAHTLKTVPKSLENLIELEELRLTSNQVQQLDFDLSKLKKLKILDLSAVPLKSFPKGIFNLEDLEELYIECVPEEDEAQKLMKLKKLKVLQLPKINPEKYTERFITFVQERKPKRMGIPLSEILGEAFIKEIEQSSQFVVRGEGTYIKCK